MSKKAKKKIYTALILDRSSSMAGTEKATIVAFNEQVDQQKLNSKNGAELFCSLVTFNGDVYEHLWNVPADELTPATDDSYKPMGSTAMRDAVGYTIDKLRDTTDYDDPNTCYLLIIISDGEENSSQQYSKAALREMIEGCQNTKKWTFTYLGCNEDYVKEIARETSIPLTNMAAWDSKDMKSATAGYKGGLGGYSGYSGCKGSAGALRSLISTNATCDTNVFSDGISFANFADAAVVDTLSADMSVPTMTTGTAPNASANIFIANAGNTVDWNKVKKYKYST